MLKFRRGFTLIEILIVVAIIALMIITVLVSMKKQRGKAEDARIKSDLQRLKIAFEDYYNDKNCYPPTTWFDDASDCGSNVLSPYLKSIPCNHKTGLPYPMEYVSAACNSGFRIYGTLQDTFDPASTSLCVGSGGSSKGNYGVSSENTTVAIDCAAPSASPVSPYPPGQYACSPSCQDFGSQAAAESAGCPATFADGQCNSQCGNPAYKCP